MALHVRALWLRHGQTLLWMGVGGMLVTAIWRLSVALPALLWVAQDPPPTDLYARHHEIQRWFEGIFVHAQAGAGDYPPASYVILWPLLGWVSVELGRWIWGLTMLAALTGLGGLLARESGAVSRPARLFLFLAPFSAYATAATFSVGQLAVHVLPALLGGLLLFHRGRDRWWADVAATGLVLFALVKPALSVPFFWVVCFAMGRWRPVLAVSVGYAALTLLAASFHDESLVVVATGWLGETPWFTRGHANLHKWLAEAGLTGWIWPATMASLLGFGGWVLAHRKADLWILAGVAALVTRLLFHHRIYDDLLVLIPLLPLFRIAALDTSADRQVAAGALFALLWASTQLPLVLLHLTPPVAVLTEAGQAVVWIAALVFLLLTARGRMASGNVPSG